MARQDQSVEGGEAYQSYGNLTVNRGMSADQMTELMFAMGKQLQVHFAEAEAKLEERLNSFRTAVLEEFAKPENESNTEAFKDPDFQFVLNDAQKVFVRDGSAELRDDLVKLLVQRSQLDGSDRVAKILNHSIELAGSFSSNEYAALAINFLLTSTELRTKDRSEFIRQLSDMIKPFHADLTFNETVYEYIEAQRCGSINRLITRDIKSIMWANYGSVLSYGFDPKKLSEFTEEDDLEVFKSVTRLASGYRGYLCFMDSDPDKLADKLRKLGTSEDKINKALALHRSTSPDADEVLKILNDEVAGFTDVHTVWDSTSLSKMNLTAVGKTIAHSSLSSRTAFNAPLRIWVQ